MKRVSEKKNYALSLVRLILASLFIALVVLASLVGYSQSLTLRLIDSSFGTLGEVTNQQALNFESHIASDISDLKAMSYITNLLSLEADATQDMLNGMATFSNFDFVSMYTLDGEGVAPDGTQINLNQYIFLDEAKTGQTLVGAPISFSIDEEPVVPIITPIYNDSTEISGFLLGTFSLKKLESLISSSFENSSYFYIVDSTGNIILSTTNENTLLDRSLTGNLLEFMANSAQIISYDDFVTVAEKIRDGESGYFSWKAGDEVRYTYYMPTNINDWYIFSFVPEENLLSTGEEITQSTLIFASVAFVAFLSLSSFIMFLRVRDTRRQRNHAQELEKIAYYDDLTGLPNLLLFKKKMAQMLTLYPHTAFALLKFDIKQFKLVNEILGSDTGDKVLCTVADISKELSDSHKDKLLVARVGSDDFLVLGEKELIENNDNRFALMEASLHERCNLKLRYHLNFRYGRYVLESNEYPIDTMLENVNLAHSLAKKNDQPLLDYDAKLKSELVHENELENRMQQALQNGEFLVYLQPKYNLALRKIQGAEALVRWKNADGKLISPGEFIPLFERNGFITTLDYYMFEQCCLLLSAWRKENLAVVPISVNFSRLHLQNPNFVKEVYAIAQKHCIPSSLLELELTESIAMDNVHLLENVMWELHQYGFLISMDDFGSGFSSLGLLKSMPVDILKIDRSFFTTDANDLRARTVVESVMQMAQRLDILTVAEGVEQKEQADYLQSINCTMSQGYYFARPMPYTDFENLLRENYDNPLATSEALAAQHRKLAPRKEKQPGTPSSK